MRNARDCLRLAVLVTLASAGALTVAPPARAGKKECAAAYVEAQKLKKDGALKKAREQLIVCAKDECSVTRKDCVAWLDEVNASLPSVVIEAKGKDGKETFDVKVTIDGEVVKDKLDVKAIELDPGTHQLKLEYEGADPIEQELILRDGQKNKVVEVSFAPQGADKPPAAAPEPDSSEPTEDKPKPAKKVPVITWVLGGVGLVALGGAGYFWLSSKSAESDLESSGCEPNCAQGDVDAIQQKRLFGDIALGVGVLSLGAAIYFWAKPASPPPAESALVDVRVGPRGAYAGVVGRF